MTSYKVDDFVFYKGWVKHETDDDDAPPVGTPVPGKYKLIYINDHPTAVFKYTIQSHDQDYQDSWVCWGAEIEPVKREKVNLNDFL